MGGTVKTVPADFLIVFFAAFGVAMFLASILR